MKRIISVFLVSMLLCCFAVPAGAVSLSETTSAAGKIELENVILGGQEMTIPVLRPSEVAQSSPFGME